MLKKRYLKDNSICNVTFILPKQVNAKKVCLCGEFNSWEKNSIEMKLDEDGNYSITIPLKTGESYKYRYILDDERWENDWQADCYLPNIYGSEDSVVEV